MRGVRRRQSLPRRSLPGGRASTGHRHHLAQPGSRLLVAACQDREISRWTPVPYPYGPSDARNYLLQRHDALHAGASAPFAVVDAADHNSLLLGSKELTLLEEFLEGEIEKVNTWENLIFIYDEHHRATYLPFHFIDDLQEKAFEILMRDSEYQAIEECYQKCQMVIKHPLFLHESEIKKNILGLLQTLKNMTDQIHVGKKEIIKMFSKIKEIMNKKMRNKKQLTLFYI